jgi:hypothetical protein
MRTPGRGVEVTQNGESQPGRYFYTTVNVLAGVYHPNRIVVVAIGADFW